MGHVCHDASSNDDTSYGSYVEGEYEQQSGYHTDNDNSSIDDSDDEIDNTIQWLQGQNRDNSSSDEDSVYHYNHEYDHTPVAKHQPVPQSISTNPIVS